MPNYSLVANTQFKARSFDDLIRPYIDYTNAYREQQDAIAELATKADVLAGLANEQTDPIAYQKYKSFESDLNRQSDILLKQGLTPSLRANLQRMRKRYATEIDTIKNAYNWKLQQI